MNIMKTMIALAAVAASCGLAMADGQEKAPGCQSGVCAVTDKPALSEEGFQLLTSGEMKRIVDSKSAIILDARTGKYDDGQRIPGAKALSPMSSKEEVSQALPDKGASIVTYCANLKCPASAALAKHLKELGYMNIKEYPEGIQGWISAGNPVEKAAK